MPDEVVMSIAAEKPDVRRHKYPIARGGGLFLILLGLGIIGGVLFARDGIVNNGVFFVGVGLATVSLFASRRLSYGRPTRTQIVALCAAIVMEIVLMNVIGRTVAPDLRIRWLWALVVVGVHFLPMTLAFGPRVLLLGLLCIASAGLSLAVGSVPFAIVGLVDGTLKTGFGAWMLFTRERGGA